MRFDGGGNSSAAVRTAAFVASCSIFITLAECVRVNGSYITVYYLFVRRFAIISRIEWWLDTASVSLLGTHYGGESVRTVCCLSIAQIARCL